MRWKKWCTVLTAACLLTGLTACGTEGNPQSESTPAHSDSSQSGTPDTSGSPSSSPSTQSEKQEPTGDAPDSACKDGTDLPFTLDISSVNPKIVCVIEQTSDDPVTVPNHVDDGSVDTFRTSLTATKASDGSYDYGVLIDTTDTKKYAPALDAYENDITASAKVSFDDGLAAGVGEKHTSVSKGHDLPKYLIAITGNTQTGAVVVYRQFQ